MSVPTPETAEALRRLAAQYARGVDRREREMFLGVFAPDGRLSVFNPSDSAEPTGEMNGHDQLARVMKGIAVYDRTHHFVGDALYDIDESGLLASGEVYCVAHHLTRSRHGGTNHVMYIRYVDEYRCGEDGAWTIADRQVLVDWTDTHHANPAPGSASAKPVAELAPRRR